MAEAVAAKVESWEIEIDHPDNSNVIIQSIPGAKLRSYLTGSRTVTDRATGEQVIPSDRAALLGALPQMPGMRLKVFPEKLEYLITDPLYDDEELCERFARMYSNKTGQPKRPIRGHAPQKGTLDKDRMKTLVREMVTLVSLGHAKVSKGQVPSPEAIEAMPGAFLTNPGSRVPNSQPRYEHEMADWRPR